MNFNQEVQKDKEEGITLIALVVTIIVLLILAGVTIATLTGDNGILTRAQEAKNKTEQAQKDEENILNSYEDKINEYVGIDWDIALANAQKHPDQKTSTAIGVGTDGRAVNMDLWEFTLLEDGTYGLNDNNVYTSTPVETTGYLGEYTEDGNIIGTIPQYISNDNGSNFIPVTSLSFTFKDCDGISKVPSIPSTVSEMRYCFQSCDGITEVDSLPDSLTIAEGIFQNCKNLVTVKKLPDSIIDLQGAFANCSNLNEIDHLPNSVTNLLSTFANCTSLEKAPIIPENVKNFINTFSGCINLHGILEINANLSEKINSVDAYNSCLYNACQTEGLSLKITGKSPNKEAIVEECQNPNITL